jgi:hypothetical protein
MLPPAVRSYVPDREAIDALNNAIALLAASHGAEYVSIADDFRDADGSMRQDYTVDGSTLLMPATRFGHDALRAT